MAFAAGSVGIASEPAEAGPAIGQFETKTLSIEPGELEFQSQNAYALDTPRRRTRRDANGELEGDPNSLPRQRHALELEFGITTFLKGRIGIEYEKERREEFTTLRGANGYEDLKLDEYAGELIGALVPRRGEGFALGVVVEYEHPTERKGARTLIAGPIIEYVSGPWYVNVNPTLVKFFGGDRDAAGRQDEKIDFGYVTQIKYRWSESFDLAVEAYGTVERIGGSGARSEEARLFGDFDQHRLGPVVYWNFEPEGMAAETEVSLGVGTLFGLNDDTPGTTLKLSLEVTF